VTPQQEIRITMELLHWQSLNGQVDAIQFLVNVVHLAINDKHSLGRTALHSCCVEGHANVCQLLLEMKADIESLNDVL
jgi:ankyrin repeat protein